MRATRRTAGSAAVACAVALASGAAALAATAAPAAADPVSLTLNYHCVFPLIGPEPLTVKIDTDVPKTVVSGQQVPGFAVDSVSTVSAGSTRGLAAVGSAKLDGTALAKASITVPDVPTGLPVPVTSKLDTTAVPAEGAFDVRADGTTVPLTFRKTGKGTIRVGDLVLTLAPTIGDGGPSGLGTFESECTQDPGQDNVLATFDVVDSTPVSTHHDYTVRGTAAIKASAGTVPLNGTLGTDIDPGTGNVTGDLDLDPATGDLKAWGFLPVTADVAFGRPGGVTGRLTGDALAADAALDMRVTSFKVFGLPVGGGDQCRTAGPAGVPLTSGGPFDPARGGGLTSPGFTLPPLQDCGPLTPLLGSFTAGPGNTADLTLTPKEQG
ncbi:MAG TPA: DUF6801 domain-containing protein [Spirillospora sp.]|nr:DUF6801 domain-containing protein [Spirillospora sp.]